jgi:hypothetical protein
MADDANLHTKVFKACCELWMLSYHVCQVRQRAATTYPDFLAEVQATFLRLLSRAGSLPVSLVRHNHSNHAVAMMQYFTHSSLE